MEILLRGTPMHARKAKGKNNIPKQTKWGKI